MLPEQYVKMMNRLLFIYIATVLFTGCHQNNTKMKDISRKQSDAMSTGQEVKEMSCKLTTPELRQRKETVIDSLKKLLIGKKELENGFSYQFNGSDTVIDELAEFIKAERLCCDFFEFDLTVSGEADKPLWLAITGPKGVKEFISSEIGL